MQTFFKVFFNTARWDIYSSTLQDGTYILQHCKMGHIFFNIARWDIYFSTLQDGTYVLQHCKMGHIFFNIARWNIFQPFGLCLQKSRKDLDKNYL